MGTISFQGVLHHADTTAVVSDGLGLRTHPSSLALRPIRREGVVTVLYTETATLLPEVPLVPRDIHERASSAKPPDFGCFSVALLAWNNLVWRGRVRRALHRPHAAALHTARWYATVRGFLHPGRLFAGRGSSDLPGARARPTHLILPCTLFHHCCFRRNLVEIY